MRDTEELDWKAIRREVEAILAEFQQRGGTLPENNRQRLTQALAEQDRETLREALALQVLLSIWINPEARVKVARGKAIAELTVNRPGAYLVEVVNDAGTRAEVRVRVQTGPESANLVAAEFVRPRTVGDRLSGSGLQYLLLLVFAREVGRREATFVLDAGQGTQDLGFRSEVPVLFRINPGKP